MAKNCEGCLNTYYNSDTGEIECIKGYIYGDGEICPHFKDTDEPEVD